LNSSKTSPTNSCLFTVIKLISKEREEIVGYHLEIKMKWNKVVCALQIEALFIMHN
jgi:hypothetical protein